MVDLDLQGPRYVDLWLSCAYAKPSPPRREIWVRSTQPSIPRL